MEPQEALLHENIYVIFARDIYHLLLNTTTLVAVLFAIIIWKLTRFAIKEWHKNRELQWTMQLKADNNRALTGLRITAYERLIVMLERITPTSLVMRHNVNAYTAAMLQLELIKAIREEFEHNVSLQMYVSEDTWERVKRAKEDTTELVKVAFTRVIPENHGIELSREIFKLEAAVGVPGIREAIQAVRYELAKNS